MRARFLNRDVLAALLMVAVALGGYESVRAGGPQAGEKIQFSEVPTASPSPNPVVVSNLNRLAPTESSFKQVKEDLMRPFGSLDPRKAMMDNAMGQPLPMPQRPAPLSRRALEALDKRKNWMFTSYQELFMPQDDVAKKMFGVKEYGDDGREKRAESVVDSYYESLGNKNNATNNQSMEEARAKFLMLNGFDPYGKTIHADGAFTQTSFEFAPSESVLEKSDGVAQTETGAMTNLASTLPAGMGMHGKRASELDNIRRSILGSSALPIDRPGPENGTLQMPDDLYSQTPKIATDNSLSKQLTDANTFKIKTANPFALADPAAGLVQSHVNDDLTAKALGMQTGSTISSNYYAKPPATAQSIEAQHDPFAANRPKPRF